MGLSFILNPAALFLEHCSFALLILLLYKFLNDLVTHVSIKNIIALIAVLQWLYGAVLGYRYEAFIKIFHYRMAIPKSEYFAYVFPATLAMLIGLYCFPSKIKMREILANLDLSQTYNKGVLFILIGFIADLLPFLGFFGYLVSNLKYIGAFYVFFSYHPKRYIWLAVVLGLLFLKSVSQGMFHDFLLWGTFFFSVYFINNRRSFLFRSLLLTIGLFVMMAIQLSKTEIRAKSWTGSLEGKEMYAYGFNTIIDKLTGQTSFFSDKIIGNNVVRLNQGWIIANVMKTVPASKPYANGETIIESVVSAIFPRFILENKATAGGRSNIKRFTSIVLNNNTSMDISQVGEAYANFGVYGGIIMMFFLGLLIALAIRFIERKSILYPELILWMPLMFLQVVKAENSLITILNHFVKAALITWFFFSPWGHALLNKVRFSQSHTK